MPSELSAYDTALDKAVESALEETQHPDPLSEFVAVERRLRELDNETDALKKRRVALEQRLLDEWADKGQQSANIAGFTVYITTDFFCNKRSGVAMPDVCRLLENSGLGNMVSPAYNAQSLKAWVKEHEGEGTIPEDLAAVLQWDTVPRLRARKA